MSFQKRRNGFLLQDVLIIAASIGIAVFLTQTDTLVMLLTSTKELEFLGSFLAGLFFTSVFTTAPAIVTLGEIARANSLVPVVVFGTLGAVIGDLLIFKFVRDRFSEHLMELAGHRSILRRAHALFKMRLFRWLSLFVGGVIIASPFPDELGIGLFGLAKVKTSWFIPLSVLFNAIGILAIGIVARTL